MYDTHVYLGPSLNLDIAKKLLPAAHYHPPVQCGDILRLLRLEPKRIIIIDGLYEVVPAVWHKEILIAMDLGIEVWGAGSMGALRAAELHQYGMKGFGTIFNDFKTGTLNDDDEVAVLHRGKEEHYSPINDAMVNIRATCDRAHHDGILTHDEKNNLIHHCKNQFYPYRSLKNAIKKLDAQQLPNKDGFATWLGVHGLVDIKKQDAMGVLTHCQQVLPTRSPPTPIDDHLTVYLREIIQYADVTPFEFEADWLPSIEKKLQVLQNESPVEYILVAELAFFTRKLFSLKPSADSLQDKSVFDEIQQHGLYSPESDFANYKNNVELADVYTLVCQTIASNRLTAETIHQYLPVIAHYYDLPEQIANHHKKTLRLLLMLMLSIKTYSGKSNTQASESVTINHCQDVMRRRNYTQSQFKEWFNPVHFNRQLFINFLMMYMTTLRGTYYRSKSIPHHRWIYDAYLFYSLEEQAYDHALSDELQHA